MAGDGDLSDPPRAAAAPPAFSLERFAWTAPGRLEVAGTFAGVDDDALDPPVLVIHGADGAHRLPADPGSISGTPGAGRWRAEFDWEDAPAFEAAQLELGSQLVLDLPEPTSPAAAEPPTSGAGADRLRLETELLEAREEIRERQVGMQVIRNELARTREDLEAERERHAADVDRFHEGVAGVRRAAEEALAAEQGASERLQADLRQAGELAQRLREQLELAEAARMAAEARSDALEAELEQTREASSGAVDRLAGARAAAREAATTAEDLLAQLADVEDRLAGGS